MQRIDLSTFRGLLNNGHGLDCYCRGCRRWASTDLVGLVRAGLGDRLIPASRPNVRIAESLFFIPTDDATIVFPVCMYLSPHPDPGRLVLAISYWRSRRQDCQPASKTDQLPAPNIDQGRRLFG